MKIDDLKIPNNFIHTAPIYQGQDSDGYDGSIAVARGSNQTDDYLKLLRLDHIITIPYQSSESTANDPNEVDIDDIYKCLLKQIGENPHSEHSNESKGCVQQN